MAAPVQQHHMDPYMINFGEVVQNPDFDLQKFMYSMTPAAQRAERQAMRIVIGSTFGKKAMRRLVLGTLPASIQV